MDYKSVIYALERDHFGLPTDPNWRGLVNYINDLVAEKRQRDKDDDERYENLRALFRHGGS